jgi:rod shape determining protein RodA
MIKSRSVFEMDLYIALATIALVVVGILFIFSSGVTADGQIVSREYLRQIAWASTGVVLMLTVTFVDYRVLSRLAVPLFGLVLILLVVTLLSGRVVNGSRSWIGIGNLGGQPSELAKLALVIVLARYFGSNPGRGKSLFGFLGGMAISLVPTVLVLAQPDLGSALVYLPIFIIIAYAAGADGRLLGFVVGTGILVALFTVLPVWEEHLAGRSVPLIAVFRSPGSILFLLGGLSLAAVLAVTGYAVTRRLIFFWILYLLAMLILAVPIAYAARSVLREYQVMRLIVFLDPYVDPRGAGWNIIQSVTAVGSGGPFGKGFLQGTQSHYQYLPQQSTDFIFSILAEEWGFTGVFAVFALFGVIIGRGLYIMASARDHFAALVVAGVIGMIIFHLVVNVGMAIGMMPITGIPLFLLSYGGSSLWTVMLGIGLVMSIYQHRYQY